MSAFMCSADHINTIVTYAQQNDLSAYFDGKTLEANKDPQSWVDTLTKCNVDSLNARYGDNEAYPATKFKRTNIRATDAQVAKLCHSFNYQACEQEDFELTRGYRLINRVLDHVLRGMKGYEEAEWAI